MVTKKSADRQMRADRENARSARLEVIRRLYADEGLSKTDIADHIGVSRERIRQIIEEQGWKEPVRVRQCSVCDRPFVAACITNTICFDCGKMGLLSRKSYESRLRMCRKELTRTIMAIAGLSKCYGCGLRPTEDFNEDSTSFNGLAKRCRSCQRQYMQSVKEVIKGNARRWCRENPEKRRIIARRWYAKTHGLPE